MNAYYNDQALHELTPKVILSSRSATADPPEAPLRWKHTLKLRLNFHEQTYADNWALVTTVRRILRVQGANLKLEDEAGNTILDQTARFLGDDWPEEPNEKNSSWFQSLTLTFEYFENLDTAENAAQRATYQRTGSGTIITLSAIEKFKVEDDTQRYSAFRSHRESTLTRLSISGKFLANPLLDLDARRAALLAAVDAARSEIHNGADGRLVFGDTDKTVRVVSFTADSDQAQDAVPFSMTVQYTRFPDEAGYAQAQFEWATREGKDGRITGSLRGEILADSEVAALSKLAAVRTSFTSGFTVAETEVARSNISGADGDSFIKLTFNETWERTSEDVTNWELRATDAEETTQGTIRRTYAGSVEATSEASFDSAYQKAMLKARVLGDSKHQFKIGSNVTLVDQQQSADKQAQPLHNFVCSLASDVNVDIAGFDEFTSFDGTFLYVGSLVLLKNQTDPTENGIYRRTGDSTLERAVEADTSTEIEALRIIKISEGVTQANTFWKLDNQGYIAIGSSDITYSAATTPWRVRVEFSFEYRLKSASRVYLEINSRLRNPTFGLQEEQVSGFVVAATASQASSVYTTFKAGYGARIRDEEVSESRIKIASDAIPAAFRESTLANATTGTVKTPPNAGSWGIGANAGEVADNTAEAGNIAAAPTLLGAGYARQWLKLEFSFTVHKPRTGTSVAMRYDLQVAKDYANNEIITTIDGGTIWAATRAIAETYLAGFLEQMSIEGELLTERTGISYERYPGHSSSSTPGDTGVDTLIGFQFSVSYSKPLTTDQQILECELEEAVECSGNRLVVQPTATSDDVLQGAYGECGYHSGTRTLTVSCKATNETAAVAWISKQRLYYPDLLPESLTSSGWRGTHAPKITFRPEFIPLKDGVGRLGKYGGGTDIPVNYKCVRATAVIAQVYQRLEWV